MDKPLIQPVEDKQSFPLSVKEIALVVVNLLSIIFLFIILSQLSGKAEELQKLRVDSTKDDGAVTFEYNQVVSYKPDLDKLSTLFLDDTGVVSFVSEVETLKGSDSSIQKVTFISQKPVKDRTGNFGIPAVIEMSGSWSQISSDLEKIQALPFLYRAATFDAKPDVLKPEIIIARYGVLLYVSNVATKK